MSFYLGIDTSNYTTSVALYDTATERVFQKKKLLPVRPGEKGIRQSDAVFHHTQQLSVLLTDLLSECRTIGVLPEDRPIGPLLKAIGVSDRPRRVSGSYMPCFTVGQHTAESLAAVLGVPLFSYSHQEGHIAAALYSAGRLDLVGQEFLAFHVSGGTTESLLVQDGAEVPLKATLLGTSSDLKAGMAIDRVGVMLGLPFPAGPELERLALQSTKTYRVHPSTKGLNCSLSGVENQCQKMLQAGEAPADIALYCLTYIKESLAAMATALLQEYPGKHLVFSGGVMSNSIIRQDFLNRFNCSFAEPVFSADNAAGISVLTVLQERS